MYYYSVPDELPCKAHLPGQLEKGSTFPDYLLVPEILVGLILHAYQDHVLSGGHLAFRRKTRPEILVTCHKSRRARLAPQMPSLSRTKNSTRQTQAPDRSFAC